jgi:beta-glucosidase-like glycosyl hydrolase
LHGQRSDGVARLAAPGADILLYTDSAPGELGALEGAGRSGKISAADAAASYRRIMALKHKLGLA